MKINVHTSDLEVAKEAMTTYAKALNEHAVTGNISRVVTYIPIDAYAAANGRFDCGDRDVLGALAFVEDKDILMDDGEPMCVVNSGMHSYPIYSNAIASMNRTFGLGGWGPNQATLEETARAANIFAPYIKGDIKIIQIGERVAAVLSRHYATYPIPDAVEDTKRILEEKLGKMEFLVMNQEMTFTQVIWRLPEKAEEFLEKYQDALNGTAGNYRGIRGEPAILFQSSDTGDCALTLMPMVYRPDHHDCISLTGSAIKVSHKVGDGDIEKLKIAVEEQFGRVYGLFDATLEGIQKMADHTVQYPMNVIRGLMDHLGLSKKLITASLNAHAVFGDDACSMHDVYLSMLDGLNAIGTDGTAKLALADKIASIIGMDESKWDEYDKEVIA